MDVKKFLRETLLGYSQKDLAIEADISESSVSRFLNGYKIKEKSLISLAEAAARISGKNPQIMLCALASVHNDAYWKRNPNPSFEPKVYTQPELEKLLTKMLNGQKQYPAINYFQCIRDTEALLAWARDVRLSPDFDLPFKFQADFKSRMDATILQAGTEFYLYELLRDLFVEIRYTLQLVGDVGLRISLAKWLLTEAEKREEQATMILASSSLAWSYTSSTGGYNNLELAEKFSQMAFEIYISVRDEIEIEPNTAVEVYESRVRISTRKGRLEEAAAYIAEGYSFLERLKPLVKGRLNTRFQTTFLYHEGLIQYRSQDYKAAEETFDAVSSAAELIGWERGYWCAISWLTTIAAARKQYERCLELAEPFTVLSFKECEVYADQNPICRSKRTVQHLISASETCYALGDNTTADILKQKANLIRGNLSWNSHIF